MNAYQMWAEIIKWICILLAICIPVAMVGDVANIYFDRKFQKTSDDSFKKENSNDE